MKLLQLLLSIVLLPFKLAQKVLPKQKPDAGRDKPKEK